eukprot:6256943-Amphidinium_carterae.1
MGSSDSDGFVPVEMEEVSSLANKANDRDQKVGEETGPPKDCTQQPERFVYKLRTERCQDAQV